MFAMLHSPIENSRLLQHVAQVDVGVQEIRIQCDGLLEVMDREPNFSLCVEHASQIAPCDREIRTRFNCFQIARLIDINPHTTTHYRTHREKEKTEQLAWVMSG